MRLIFGILLVVLSFSFALEAKKFDFNKRSIAAYVRGTYGMNRLQRMAYEPGLPAGLGYGDTPITTQHFSGEFGGQFILGSTVSLRLGFEVLSPLAVRGGTATNAVGTEILGFDSEVNSIIPQANIEVYVRKTQTWRVFVGGGVGYAYTTIKNTIRPTTVGQSVLQTSDYVEEGTANNLTYSGFVGFEAAFVDNLSVSFDLGYRFLNATDFKSTRDSTTYVGPVGKGDTIRNADGTTRSADLSGPFAGITLRFFIF